MGTIQIEGLSRSFKGTTAVDAVDITVQDGDFLVLLGPSGCGKTTLLRMIAGLLEPTAGTIRLDGADITSAASKKRDIAMVFQSYALYPHLTVYKNLAFPLTVRKAAKHVIDAKVREIAAILEIDHLLERRPKELSGGQRQRVAVGRALVRDPKAFLMDEPLSNLDASLRTQTRQELARLHRRLGATFVYVTHDQVEAMTMATRIAVMNKGRVEQVGTPMEVYDRPASVFVAGFIGSPAMNLIPASVTTLDGDVHLAGSDFAAALWPGETVDIDVVLGVRPEQLRVLDPGESAAIMFRVDVDAVENLGNEELIYGETEGRRVCVRRPRTSHPVPTGPTLVGLDLDCLHLFEQSSGRRLEWRAEDSGSPAAGPAASAVVAPAASAQPGPRQAVAAAH